MKDRSNFIIATLGVSAFVLALGHVSLTGNQAQAAESVVGRGYSISTARVIDGGEGVYVFDNTSEKVALFIWDTQSKRFTPRDVRRISEFFANGR
ncbi:MAG: hypothetical protein QM770_13165 [Tepidisphaeraceae bacterium]